MGSSFAHTSKFRSSLLAATLGVCVGFGAGIARADVVAPPDDGACPPGTTPGASHGLDPAFCSVVTCTTDADCQGNLVCTTQPLCSDGSWATSTCESGTCPNSFACMQQQVCLPPSETANGDCNGCSAGDAPLLGTSFAILVLAGLGLGLGLGRRRGQSLDRPRPSADRPDG